MPYGEVLYSVAAKEYGVNCAKYDFATYKGEVGTISYDLAYGTDNIAIDGLTLVARYNPDHLPDIMRKNTNNLDVIMMLNKKYKYYTIPLRLCQLFRVMRFTRKANYDIIPL